MKYIVTIIALLYAISSSAQRISITPGMEKIGDEYQQAYNVFIPHATPKAAMKAFSEFLKDYKAKVKTSGDQITANNVLIPVLSVDTLMVQGSVNAVSDGAVLIAGFKNSQGYISETNDATASQNIIRMLKDMALPVAKSGLKEKIEVAEKAVKAKEKEEDELVHRNEKLENDNKKMKDQIHDNEREMETNKGKIDQAKNAKRIAKDALDTVKSKESDLN